MRKHYLAIIGLFIGLQAPALAIWNIPSDAVKPDVMKQITLPSMSKKSNWLDAMPRQQISANAAVVAPPVVNAARTRNCWTERSANSTIVTRNDYMKTAEDVKVMNPVLHVAGAPNPSAVPEPGSIVGLSTGVLGLLFQIRRKRK